MGLIVRSPWPLLIITLGYLTFVYFLGPAFMRNRRAYELKNIIRAYNLIEVILSTIMFYRTTQAINGFHTYFSLNKIFSLDDGSSERLFQMGELVLMARLTELLDTIFFTLRKKTNQITFLHVYHHAFVPLYGYWTHRSAPTRFNNFILAINSLIHMLMYSYYLLATFDRRAGVASESPPPASSSSRRQATTRSRAGSPLLAALIARLMRFKKYMTQLQLIQFVVLLFYTLWPVVESFVRSRPCPVPARYIASNLYVALSFLGMFMHFYIRSYGTKKRPERRR